MLSASTLSSSFSSLWRGPPARIRRLLLVAATRAHSSATGASRARGGLPRFHTPSLPSSKELGACSVTPLLTERCHTIAENRVDRLQRLVLAAVKQCTTVCICCCYQNFSQRIHEMSLRAPIQIGNLLPVVIFHFLCTVDLLLRQVSQSKLAFLASAEAPPLLSVLPKSSNEQSGLLIIGPEGGNKI
ncbi:hypothetical protein BAE44_0004491 [Dichanthelium oligosanthes]|uniref:16S rRNA (uracil(1498)-N(3))-methyltransferase n=1 Tax=Dichanthelium oligosanthes TaxID=888268 RepID=A0A1E5WAY1_9POAL|nr:hypothetical protein BAE44_0004491 [Dichanthelium oligosanthes]